MTLKLDRSASLPGEDRGLAYRARRGPLDRESLTHELVAAHREAAALRRENDRLRSRLRPREPATGFRGTRGDLVVDGPVWCRRCGLTLDRAAVQRDETLVLASCCPLCDGPLVGVAARGQRNPDPSVFLG